MVVLLPGPSHTSSVRFRVVSGALYSRPSEPSSPGVAPKHLHAQSTPFGSSVLSLPCSYLIFTVEVGLLFAGVGCIVVCCV